MTLTDKDVYELRGKAVSAFAYVEHLISLFISTHYFGSNSKRRQFSEEVLEHSYFSFDLKKKVLYLLLKSYYPDHEFPKKDLDRLQELRNLIAHATLAGKTLGPMKVQPLFRHQGKDHGIKETFEEWDKLIEVINPEVKKLPNLNLETFDAPFELN